MFFEEIEKFWSNFDPNTMSNTTSIKTSDISLPLVYTSTDRFILVRRVFVLESLSTRGSEEICH